MNGDAKKGLAPNDVVAPGFEAIYTGKKVATPGERPEVGATVTADEAGNELMTWPVFTWTFAGEEKNWDQEIQHINSMQVKLGPLDDRVRQIRAHIGSFVPCDSGFPVSVDELLYAIGREELPEPSFKNGCWMPGMWWEQRTTQPGQVESMRVIHSILMDYLSGVSSDELVERFPHAKGFIGRAYDWLGPVTELSEVQVLQIRRVLPTVECFVKWGFTERRDLILDASKMEELTAVGNDLFTDENGLGARLDAEISEKAGLPKVGPYWRPEYKEDLERLSEPRERELYRTSCAIASGVCSISDCHHNTFRYIEGWIHGIGTGKLEDPSRKSGAEKERLGRSLFGYVLGLDRWLQGVPMQFVLMDMGHVDLGFDPKNEVLRVYAHLGQEGTPVKEWLAACLWHNLSYNPVGGKENPAGLVRHKDLLDRAAEFGISAREWIDSALELGSS